MRIGCATEVFPRLSETFVLHQALGLMERGHEVEILCRETNNVPVGLIDEAEALDGCTRRWWGPLAGLDGPVERLPTAAGHKLRSALDTLDAAHLKRFDALVAHFGYQGQRVANVMKRITGLPPLITIFHGHDVATVEHAGTMEMYRDLFRHGALHLTVNEQFRQALISAGAPAERTRVHHMGISLDKFPYVPRDWTARPIRILSVCRLTEKKGIEYALRALARAREARPQLQWSYRIAGDGKLRDGLEQLATELGIRDIVTFLGAQPHAEVQKLLSESHILLQPSVTAANGDAEGIPVALMEAMASGAIVISSVHSGIPELISDGVTGFLAPERADAELGRKLLEAADSAPRLDEMARAARRKVELDFNIDVQVSRLESEILSVL